MTVCVGVLFYRRQHHIPVGVPAAAVAGARHMPPLHQVDRPTAGHLQAGRLQGGVQAMGVPQEQAGHDLRDDGQGVEVGTSGGQSMLGSPRLG